MKRIPKNGYTTIQVSSFYGHLEPAIAQNPASNWDSPLLIITATIQPAAVTVQTASTHGIHCRNNKAGRTNKAMDEAHHCTIPSHTDIRISLWDVDQCGELWAKSSSHQLLLNLSANFSLYSQTRTTNKRSFKRLLMTTSNCTEDRQQYLFKLHSFFKRTSNL